MISTSTHASHLEKDSDSSEVHSAVASHLDTLYATRLGALSASAWVRNAPPDQEQSLTLGELSGFAHLGMYPLDLIILTFDVMLFRS